MRKYLAVTVIPLLVACGGNPETEESAKESSSAVIRAAGEACSAHEEVAADDDVVVITNLGDNDLDRAEGLDATFAAIDCMLTETDAPATMESKLSATTAQSGRQESTYDGILAGWSYDGGSYAFEMTFEPKG